ATISDVQIGISALGASQPKVIYDVAEGAGVERELAEHRGVVPAPVVDHVVTEIENARVLHQRSSRTEIRVEVVVQRDIFRRVVASNMLTHETLADDVPLKARPVQV